MAERNVYHPTHGLTLDDTDALSAASHKLHALLANAHGECGESFRNTSDSIQDTYLWACADLARDIQELVSKMCKLV